MTIIPRLNLLLRELDRRNRPAAGIARMEIRRPWSSSSETVSAVSALQVAEDRGLADKFGLGLLLANVRFAPEAAIRSSCISDPAAHARLTKQHRARLLPTTLLASSCRRQRRSQNLALKLSRSHGPNRSLLRSNQHGPPI